MDSVTGPVVGVYFESGRNGEVLELYLDTEFTNPHELRIGYGSFVTCDDKEGVILTDLLVWIARHRCSVTLHPEEDGMSKRAEFVSTKEKP